MTVIISQNTGTVRRTDTACVDLTAHKFRHATVQIVGKILHLTEHVLDTDALQQRFYPESVFFLSFCVYMHFIDTVEQIILKTSVGWCLECFVFYFWQGNGLLPLNGIVMCQTKDFSNQTAGGEYDYNTYGN